MSKILKEKPLLFQVYFLPLMNAITLFLVGIWHINESVDHDFPYLIPIFFGVVLLALNNQLKFETKAVMVAALILSLFVLASLIYYRGHIISPIETISAIRVYAMITTCSLACLSLFIHLIRK